jgi:hypothetical protein
MPCRGDGLRRWVRISHFPTASSSRNWQIKRFDINQLTPIQFASARNPSQKKGQAFAGDLPEAKAKCPMTSSNRSRRRCSLAKRPVRHGAISLVFYAVSTEDRTINPDLERFLAKRMVAKTVGVKASHLSLISQPDEIAQLILEAAGHHA